MADKPKNPKEFPDLSEKLTAPTRKTAAQREKEAKEAKAKRQAALDAAKIAEIQAEFGGSDDEDVGSGFPANVPRGPSGGGGYGRGGGFSGPPPRHFAPTGQMRKSGPGTLGPEPITRKRPFDTYRDEQTNRYGGGRRQDPAVSFRSSRAFHDDDDDGDVLTGIEKKAEAKAAARPTVLISCVPTRFTEKDIRALIAPHLKVEKVEIQAPSGPSGPPSSRDERKSLTAVVILSAGTRSDTIDEVVSKLRNTYLGFGCFLSISPHLSTAAVNFSAPVSAGLSTGSNTKPFGARNTEPNNGAPKLNFAPTEELRGDTGAHAVYQPKAPRSAEQVVVLPPTDLTELQLINKTIEKVYRYGPEFEAALLGKVQVQKNIKWAWIWDSTSKGGIYYRWRLWEVLSGSAKHKDEDEVRIFDGMAPWVGPGKLPLPIEFSADIDDLAVDSDADIPDSSDDYSSSEDENPQKIDGDREYLTPQKKAELLFILRALPKRIAQLQNKHVATITHFAIFNANKGYGVHEIVRMLVTNIERPFNTLHYDDAAATDEIDLSDWEIEEEADTETTVADLTMASQLVALYIVLDLILNSGTGGTGAWKYRQYFENALRNRGIFKKLGRLAWEHNLGKMRAERLRRQVMVFLDELQQAGIFTENLCNEFRDAYDNALTKTEIEEAQKQTEREASESNKKPVNNSDPANSKNGILVVSEADIPIPTTEVEMDVDKPEQVEQVNISTGNAGGEPVEDNPTIPSTNGPSNGASPEKSQPLHAAPSTINQKPSTAPRITFASKQKQQPQRPKAIDMFGDSD